MKFDIYYLAYLDLKAKSKIQRYVWRKVAYPFRTLVVMHQMLAIDLLSMKWINVWDSVSALIHLPSMSLSTGYLFEKKKTDWTNYLRPPL